MGDENMGIEAVGIAVGVAEGFIENYFYDKKVDKLRDAVDKVMSNAHQKAEALMADGFSGLTVQQIDFFNHVDLSLQGVKNIYEAEMNLTVDKVDQKAQAILASVDTIVHNWTRELINPQMQQLVYEARAIVNSLPFVDHRPRLTTFSPTLVAPSSKPFNILIRCIGNFPSFPDSKARPTLHFNQKEYLSIRNQPDIAFAVPLHDLFPLGGNSMHGIRSASFEVKIPYADQSYWSYFLSLFRPSEACDIYQGSISLLPESPGKITIYYTKMKKVEEKETIVSEEYRQSSRPEDVGENMGFYFGFPLKKLYTLQAKAGWKIVPESVQFHVKSNKGAKENVEALKNKWNLHEVTPEKATYQVTTHYYEPVDH